MAVKERHLTSLERYQREINSWLQLGARLFSQERIVALMELAPSSHSLLTLSPAAAGTISLCAGELRKVVAVVLQILKKKKSGGEGGGREVVQNKTYAVLADLF